MDSISPCAHGLGEADLFLVAKASKMCGVPSDLRSAYAFLVENMKTQSIHCGGWRARGVTEEGAGGVN